MGIVVLLLWRFGHWLQCNCCCCTSTGCTTATTTYFLPIKGHFESISTITFGCTNYYYGKEKDDCISSLTGGNFYSTRRLFCCLWPLQFHLAHGKWSISADNWLFIKGISIYLPSSKVVRLSGVKRCNLIRLAINTGVEKCTVISNVALVYNHTHAIDNNWPFDESRQ